jgi:hypothetical protein
VIKVQLPAAMRGKNSAKRRALALAVGRAVRAVLEDGQHQDVRDDLAWCSLHFCSLGGHSFTIRLYDSREDKDG